MTISDPLVSIILPTYNRAEVLPRAIHSVLSQDFGNYELIIIDDGSTQEMQAVIQQFGDPRIRSFRFEANQGVGKARYEGIKQARGCLISFIDSDDMWMPGKLSYQVSLFKKYSEVEIIFGNFHNMNAVTGEEGHGFSQAKQSLGMLDVRSPEDGFYIVERGIPEAILKQNFFATPTVMLRSKVFEKVGNFNVTLSGGEDFEFWFRAALRGICYAYTTNILIERCKDEKSVTSKTLLFVPYYLNALDICEKTAIECGRTDLIIHIHQARQRAWISLLRAYGLEGMRRKAWQAFCKSMYFGISYEACLYFIGAMAGTRIIAWVKKMRQR